MKNKLISMIVAFAILPCTLCHASQLTVTRDYITRKSGGEKKNEEKILVNYPEVRIEQGDFIVVSFFDKDDNMLEQCEIELSVNELAENEMFLKSQLLSGTAYIKIDFVGPGYNSDGIKLPLKI